MLARKVIKVETCHNPYDLFIDTNCFFHAGHLGVRTGLKRCDVWATKLGLGFKYYASLAKLSHVCRDLARPLRERWQAVYGPWELLGNFVSP